MSRDVAEALKHLRDALRTPVADVETFTDVLTTSVTSLQLDKGSSNVSTPDVLRAIKRYLPATQLSLLSLHVPTFLPALDEIAIGFLKTLFVPLTEVDNLPVRREIALSSYLTLSSLLSTKSISPLPRESRQYAVDLLDDLTSYSIADIYWAIWSSSSNIEGSKEASARELQWEDAVSAVIGLPGKLANAAGRWKSEDWTGTIPERLDPR